MDENNGRVYLDKLRKLGYFNHLTIKEHQVATQEWKVRYYLDDLSTWYIDNNKTVAHKICALLCINSLLHRGSRIDATISPLLIKLGYIA